MFQGSPYINQELGTKKSDPLEDALTTPGPKIINGELEYKVEAILDSWHFWNWLQFLVSWKGYV